MKLAYNHNLFTLTAGEVMRKLQVRNTKLLVCYHETAAPCPIRKGNGKDKGMCIIKSP